MSIQGGEPTERRSSGASDLLGAGKRRAAQKIAKTAGRCGSRSLSQSIAGAGVGRGTELSAGCVTLRRIQIIGDLSCRLQIRADGAGQAGKMGGAGDAGRVSRAGRADRAGRDRRAGGAGGAGRSSSAGEAHEVTWVC